MMCILCLAIVEQRSVGGGSIEIERMGVTTQYNTIQYNMQPRPPPALQLFVLMV